MDLTRTPQIALKGPKVQKGPNCGRIKNKRLRLFTVKKGFRNTFLILSSEYYKRVYALLGQCTSIYKPFAILCLSSSNVFIHIFSAAPPLSFYRLFLSLNFLVKLLNFLVKELHGPNLLSLYIVILILAITQITFLTLSIVYKSARRGTDQLSLLMVIQHVIFF